MKVNLNKSTLLGIGVPKKQVSLLENHIGCGSIVTLFSYLGLVVGRMLNHLVLWKEVVSKVAMILSRWKVNILLVSGRLTLIKLVLGFIHTFYMCLFKALMGVLQ